MKLWQLVLIALKAALLVSGVARGEVVSIVSDLGNGAKGYGTGITSGEFPDGQVAIFTAGHNVEGAKSVAITWEGGMISADVVCAVAETKLDVAVLAVTLPSKWQPIYFVRNPPQESPVVYFGFKFNRGVESREYQRREGVADIERGTIPGCDCVYGNSGGPVIIRGLGCVGLIRSRNAVGRLDSRGVPVGPATNFLPSHEIMAWVDRQNLNIVAPPEERTQCVNGRCYVQPRGYVVRQPPMIVQPPPVVIEQPPPVVTYPGGIRKPVVPPPPREEPIAQQPPCQCKPARGCNCSTPMVGANGAQGPAGPRGPKGEPGEKCECRSVDADIAALKAEIKRLKETPTKVQIKENGKLVDEDVYQPGQPIVLDFVQDDK